MKLQFLATAEFLATAALVGTAYASGMEHISFYWTVIPAFLAGSLSLSNGPQFDTILAANRRGNRWLFPALLAIATAWHAAGAFAIYAIIKWLAA